MNIYTPEEIEAMIATTTNEIVKVAREVPELDEMKEINQRIIKALFGKLETLFAIKNLGQEIQ